MSTIEAAETAIAYTLWNVEIQVWGRVRIKKGWFSRLSEAQSLLASWPWMGLGVYEWKDEAGELRGAVADEMRILIGGEVISRKFFSTHIHDGIELTVEEGR